MKSFPLECPALAARKGVRIQFAKVASDISDLLLSPLKCADRASWRSKILSSAAQGTKSSGLFSQHTWFALKCKILHSFCSVCNLCCTGSYKSVQCTFCALFCRAIASNCTFILPFFCSDLYILEHGGPGFTSALRVKPFWTEHCTDRSPCEAVSSQASSCLLFHHFPPFRRPSPNLFALFIAFSTPTHLHLAHFRCSQCILWVSVPSTIFKG